MARADFHTRIVGWLKVVLPLTALGILSTLFLLADRIDPSDAIPYADVDVEGLARDPRMTTPTYAGTTSDGAAITVRAATARPAAGDQGAAATGVLASIATPDGAYTELTAAEARLDSENQTLFMTGGVKLANSTGYAITSDGMSARLDRSYVSSTGQVTADGPPGRLTADSMTLSLQDGGENRYLLVFKGQVKLVYQPGG